jgi:hypothetical protein
MTRLPEKFFQRRITDYSYEACSFVENIQIDTFVHQELIRLYNYQKTNEGIHPMTNWASHRLMLQACIATKLKNTSMINEVHNKLIRWYTSTSDCKCCDANSQDWHHRDSLQYLVYGLIAYVRAGRYLKSHTKYDYKKLIKPSLDFLEPYVEEKKIHIEFRNSKIPSDKMKPDYLKQFDPNYTQNFYRLLAQL